MQWMRIVKWMGVGLIFLVGVVLLVAVGSAWWGPWALKRGVEISGMEWKGSGGGRDGWLTWRWEHLAISGSWGRVEVEQAEVPQIWPLARWWFGGGETVAIHARQVDLWLAGASGDGEDTQAAEDLVVEEDLVAEVVDTWKVEEVKQLLERLPEVEVGRFRWFAEGAETVRLAVEGIRLEERALRGHLEHPVAVGLRAALEPVPDGIRVTGAVESEGVPLKWEAEWDGTTWAVDLSGSEWPIPQGGLPEAWPRLEKPVVSLRGTVEESGYALSGQLAAEGGAQWPDALEADVALSGEWDRIRLERLSVEGGWLRADLSSPVELAWPELRAAEPAQFLVEADLGGQQWFPAKGQVRGEASLTGAETGPAAVDFELSGEAVSWADSPEAAMELKGRYRHPRIELERVEAGFGEESRVSAEGWLWLDEQTVRLSAQGHVGLEAEQWLPEGIVLPEGSDFTATVSGDWRAPEHRGTLEAKALEVTGLRPMGISVEWEGAAAERVSGRLEAKGEGGRTVVVGIRTEQVTAEAVDLRVEELGGEFSPETGRWAMEEPAALRLAAGESGWNLDRVGAFAIVSSEGGSIGGELARKEAGGGTVRLRLEQVGSELVDGWLTESLPTVEVGLFSVAAQVGAEGGVSGDLETKLAYEEAGGGRWFMQAAGSGDTAGWKVESVALARGEENLVSGAFTVPLALRMEGFPMGEVGWDWVPQAGLSGQLEVDAAAEAMAGLSAFPWARALGGLTGKVELAGSLEEPEARLQLSLPRSRGWGATREILEGHPLEGVRVEANWNQERLRVEQVRAEWAGTSLAASGEIPQADLWSFINGSERELGPLWRAMRGELELNPLEIKRVAELLPPVIRPAGTVEARIICEPGLELGGQVTARGLGLRSTLYTAPLEGVEVEAVLRGQRLEWTRGRGQIGTGELSLMGWLDWSDAGRLRYQIGLEGERLPLVRTPDLLVRSDLSLTMEQDGRSPTRIGGHVQLRDSVVLVEMNPLAARTRGGAGARPPFFAVEAAPYDDWELAVEFSGDHAVQVRGPYMEAVLSLGAQLEGTLGNPLLLARLRTESGELIFPGTSLRLATGEVFISRERPHTMQLDLRAHGQTASYGVSLEIDGSVGDPRLLLASTPELEQAEIVRLLATGSLQGGGLGSLGWYLGRGLMGPGSGGGGWLENFSVEVGREVSESGRDTVDLYYGFTDDLYLHGQYDEYDEQNMDFVWEVYEK